MFPCPLLEGEGECSEERRRHIADRHPDLLADGWEQIAETLSDPDQVRRSIRFANARLFSRWYDAFGKHVDVVVVTEPAGRHWVVTSYLARKLATGDLEWYRS